MDQALKDYFSIKRKINPEDMDAVREWILINAPKATMMNLASHNGKYIHPSVGKETSCIAIEKDSGNDGYLKTGNCSCRYIDSIMHLDCVGNAAALGVLGFLSIKLSDGIMIFDLVRKKSLRLQKELGFDDETFKKICDELMTILPNQSTRKTSDLQKQVYFPVEEDYHLLTILSPSVMMVEMKERIRSEYLFSENVQEGKKAKGKGLYHKGYATIFELTGISYGGSKAQNIGNLNVLSSGTTYALSSQPPMLQTKTIRFPRVDFFKECLPRYVFEDRFDALYRIIGTDYNNRRIRLARERLYISIIDSIVEISILIRKQESGWSFREYYHSLPPYQKIWLDQAQKIEQDAKFIWFDNIVDNCVRWIFNFLPQSRKGQSSPLGDEEFSYIKSLVLEVKEAFV